MKNQPSSTSNKIRLDDLLVRKQFAPSKSQAQHLIHSGNVSINQTILSKPGKLTPINSIISISAPLLFVSRAGEKLHAYIQEFSPNLKNKTALDIGASTGGFTDCLLQNNVTSVTCIDVGQNQLHPQLIKDPRVSNFEKINARNLNFTTLPYPSYDIITIDISFISLTKVLPTIWPGLNKNGLLIALVKPQFEATKEEMNHCQGIIKNPLIQIRIFKEIKTFITEQLPQVSIQAEMDSPILGADGNKEFILALTKS